MAPTHFHWGPAYGAALNYGTSYLGFNASRTSSGWNMAGDGSHNGGGVAYSSIYGDIYFAPMGASGTGGRTLSDVDITNKITFHIASDGTTYAKQIKVQAGVFPDYVFDKNYKLQSLADLKNYIEKKHHLPKIIFALIYFFRKAWNSNYI